MKNYFSRCTAVVYAALMLIMMFSIPVTAQQVSAERDKLSFLLGEWTSVSVHQVSGEKTCGHSIVECIMQKRWLQWKFSTQMEDGSLEVMTLINYSAERKQFTFYSFNSLDDEPLPHFGTWVSADTLRLLIPEERGATRIDIIPQGPDLFEQIHSSVNVSGEAEIFAITEYHRKRYSP